MAKWFLVFGFWFLATAIACQSGDDDDSTVTADDDGSDDDSDDDNSCAACETTSECTEALGAEWACNDGCCIFYGDDPDDDGDDDSDDDADDDIFDDDEDFETACADDTNHTDVADGEFQGRVVLVQPDPVLEGAEQVWRFNVCNMTAPEADGDYWIGYFKLRLPNQDWAFSVPVERPNALHDGEWTTDGPQNTGGIQFAEWVHKSAVPSNGDVREREHAAFDVSLESATLVVPSDAFEFVIESIGDYDDFNASGSIAIQ